MSDMLDEAKGPLEDQLSDLDALDALAPTDEELAAMEAEIAAEEIGLAPADMRALAAFEVMRVKAVAHYDAALEMLPAKPQADLTDPAQSLQVALREIALGLKSIAGG